MKIKCIQRAFTLIELVVVIALLGILVAVAIPKYVDITDKTKKAADEHYVGGLRSATYVLYTSNIAYGVVVTHTIPVGLTNYWPTEDQITNQMSEQYTLQYYTNKVYCPDSNGIWYLQR